MKRDKTIALSFDDGPAEDTPTILETLERFGARATFFVLGARIPGREHLLERMLAGGFEIGNHTYRHLRLSSLGERDLNDEIAETSREISRAVGVRPSLLRPPYGDWGPQLPEVARRLGIVPVLWTLSTHDYDGKSAAEIGTLVLESIAPGDIVLLHDGSPAGESRRATADAVLQLVPALQSRGFSLETVSDVLKQYPRTFRYVVPGNPGFGRVTAVGRVRRLIRTHV